MSVLAQARLPRWDHRPNHLFEKGHRGSGERSDDIMQAIHSPALAQKAVSGNMHQTVGCGTRAASNRQPAGCRPSECSFLRL